MARFVEIIVERQGSRWTYRSPAGLIAVDGFAIGSGVIRVDGIDGRGRRVGEPAESTSDSPFRNADPELADAGRRPASCSVLLVTEPFQDIRVRVDAGAWRWVRSDERGAATVDWTGETIDVRCATADGVLRSVHIRI